MRIFEKILLKSCLYTVLILTLFYSFASIGKLTSAAIGFGTFALIYLFGLIISLTDLVLSVERLRYVFRLAIHYSVLLIVFCIVFVNMGKISLKSAGAVFTSIVIFTLLYGVLLTVVYIFQRFAKKGDDFIESRSQKRTENNTKKQEYKSLYK